MSLDLAYLAIDRSPYTGHLHYCLLVVALDADHRDVVRMSHSSLAFQARISRRKAQEAFKRFEADGLLTRIRFGSRDNPHAHWFQVYRSALFGLPRGEKKVTHWVRPQRVGGISRRNAEKRIKATIDAASRDAATRVKAVTALDDRQRLAFLRSLRPNP